MRRLSARFRNVVLPGTPITVNLGAFDANGNVSFSTLNAEEEPALANGLVTIDGACGAR